MSRIEPTMATRSVHKVYGLVGYPLGHSFSQRFFSAKFEREGIDAEYLNFEIASIDELSRVLSVPDIRGFNVTIPYKQKVIPFLTRVDATAGTVGAVNVVKIEQDGTLTGYNSDIYGFVESIRPLLSNAQHDRALVLGTGGASRAVVAGLKSLGIKSTLVSRYPTDNGITYGDVDDDVIKSHTVIVNTTPLGMYPKVDTAPVIQYDAITERHVVFDLVYNPEITEFMRRASSMGATVKNGLEMLHLQARRAWEIWTDNLP